MSFEEVVRRALDSLPAEIAGYMENVAVVVEDENAEDPDLARALLEEPYMPAQITIYRLPLEESFPDPVALEEEIRITVLHEIGHYFGMDEADRPARLRLAMMSRRPPGRRPRRLRRDERTLRRLAVGDRRRPSRPLDTRLLSPVFPSDRTSSSSAVGRASGRRRPLPASAGSRAWTSRGAQIERARKALPGAELIQGTSRRRRSRQVRATPWSRSSL